MWFPLSFQISFGLHFFLYLLFYELKCFGSNRFGSRSTFGFLHQMVLPYFSLHLCNFGTLLPVKVHNFSQVLQKTLFIVLIRLILLQMDTFINFFPQQDVFFVDQLELQFFCQFQLILLPDDILDIIFSPFKLELLNLSSKFAYKFFLDCNFFQNASMGLVACRISWICRLGLNELHLLFDVLDLVVKFVILRDETHPIFAVLVGVLCYLHLIILLQGLLIQNYPFSQSNQKK